MLVVRQCQLWESEILSRGLESEVVGSHILAHGKHFPGLGNSKRKGLGWGPTWPVREIANIPSGRSTVREGESDSR